DLMDGLYPCYFTHAGVDKKLFATQVESHHAREVFPCIDEPAAKATFDLTLLTPVDSNSTVLANTPIVSQRKIPNPQTTGTTKSKSKTGGSIQETVFEQTPIMSTYLLAFAYGEMGYKESKTKRGTIVRTYAT